MTNNSPPRRIQRFNAEHARGVVYCSDAVEYLKTMQKQSADIVFLDPPFNLGKQYSKKNPSLDRRSDDEYELWMRTVLDESVRVLKHGGALYLYHIPVWAMKFGAHLGGSLELRHWIAIAMKNGFVRGDNLYPAHYALLYFTKGAPNTFNRPKIEPDMCRHCNGYIKDYGGYIKIIEDKGLNLSDFWGDLSPVRHASKKSRKQNELPRELTDRVVAISGTSGMLLVDPFVGSGTSALSAAEAGLRFKVCDILLDNCKLTCSRIETQRNIKG